MKSITRRVALLGVAVPILLGSGIQASSAATAPDAHLTSAQVTFTTTDENKDFDTAVRVSVETPAGRAVATFSDNGTEYKNNSVHGPFLMQVDSTATAAMLSSGLVRITIGPNGNDTWRFSYELTLFFGDNTSFLIRDSNLSLSESHQELTTPFSLTTQVSVPNVIGLSLAGAGSVLQSAGLSIGSVGRVVDPTCEFINKVKFQSPNPGTVVNVGSVVNVTLGVRPRICE